MGYSPYLPKSSKARFLTQIATRRCQAGRLSFYLKPLNRCLGHEFGWEIIGDLIWWERIESVDFRFGWTSKAPFTIAIQFVNHAYANRKFKFAIKDVTSNKMIVLDTLHNSRFGSEALKANSVGIIWSGLVDNIRDNFSLRVWDSDGDEFDKVPISISDQK